MQAQPIDGQKVTLANGSQDEIVGYRLDPDRYEVATLPLYVATITNGKEVLIIPAENVVDDGPFWRQIKSKDVGNYERSFALQALKDLFGRATDRAEHNGAVKVYLFEYGSTNDYYLAFMVADGKLTNISDYLGAVIGFSGKYRTLKGKKSKIISDLGTTSVILFGDPSHIDATAYSVWG